MRGLIALILVWLLVGCAGTAPQKGGDILALGDSVMAWNGDQAIPAVIEKRLGRQVVSKAVPGAQFDNPSALFGAVGFDVQKQFPGGTWNWIVLNGGANDLSQDCGCGLCTDSVNGLISRDGSSGAIPAFIARLRKETGARILWMGYYKGTGAGSFEGCRGDLVEIERRIASLAARDPNIFFVDSESIIDPTNLDYFASDKVHPSALGSALIGALLAQEIGRHSQAASGSL